MAIRAAFAEFFSMLVFVFAAEGSGMSYNNLTQALLFLSHFMGDIHQPLHVGFLGDKGGNTIDVHWYKQKQNLHHTQIECHENMILKQENEKLRAENSVMREAMANPMCNNCGGAAIPWQISFDEHQIRIENA